MRALPSGISRPGEHTNTGIPANIASPVWDSISRVYSRMNYLLNFDYFCSVRMSLEVLYHGLVYRSV